MRAGRRLRQVNPRQNRLIHDLDAHVAGGTGHDVHCALDGGAIQVGELGGGDLAELKGNHMSPWHHHFMSSAVV